MKQCRDCGIIKEYANFYKFARNKDGLRNICKQCWPKTVLTQREIDPIRAAKDQRKSRLKSKYGLSLDDFNKMVETQDGKCCVCMKAVKRFHVDHSHVTGRVRGLLCGGCNTGIGLLKDSSDICLSAYNYLEKHK